jgi:hypothetical protein
VHAGCARWPGCAEACGAAEWAIPDPEPDDE